MYNYINMNTIIHVLLIEDNDDHAELAARQISNSEMPIKLTRLSDGQEALDFLFHKGQFTDAESALQPNLILVDLRLPKVDGIDVIKIIKNDEQLRHIPVIVLTTSDAERDVLDAYKNHVNSYIVKPVDFQKLQQLMKDLRSYWFVWNKSPTTNKSPE